MKNEGLKKIVNEENKINKEEEFDNEGFDKREHGLKDKIYLDFKHNPEIRRTKEW